MQDIVTPLLPEFAHVPHIIDILCDYAGDERRNFYVCSVKTIDGEAVNFVSIVPEYAMKLLFNWKLIRDTVLSGGSVDDLVLASPLTDKYQCDIKEYKSPLDAIKHGMRFYTHKEKTIARDVIRDTGIHPEYTVYTYFDEFMGDGSLNRAFCDFPLMMRSSDDVNFVDPNYWHDNSYLVTYYLLRVNVHGISFKYVNVEGLTEREIEPLIKFIDDNLIRINGFRATVTPKRVIEYTRNYSRCYNDTSPDPNLESKKSPTIRYILKQVSDQMTILTLEKHHMIDHDYLVRATHDLYGY
jgi:hypothetical protein